LKTPTARRFSHTGIQLICAAILSLLGLALQAEAAPPFDRADVESDGGILLSSEWRYHDGDDAAWADPSFDDGDWEQVDSRLPATALPRNGWNNIGWFRTRIAVDSTLWNIPLALEDRIHFGTSQIYLNGRLVQSFGRAETGQGDSEGHWGYVRPFQFDAQSDQLIAVRFANPDAAEYHSTWGTAGFLFALTDPERAIDSLIERQKSAKTSQLILAGIPLLLSCLHILLFLSYPQSKKDLFFAICTAFYAAAIFCLYQVYPVGLSTESLHYPYLLRLFFQLYVLASMMTLRFVYALYYKKCPRLFWVFLATGIGLGFATWSRPLENLPLFGIYCLVTYLEISRVVLTAVLAKKREAWIMGIGFLALILGGSHDFLVKLEIIPPIVGDLNSFTFPFGLLGLLASMSIYLARSVAKAKKDREFVQHAFGHYLSPAIVDQIIANPDMIDQLGGEVRNMTAFFSDIASFSTISECLTPHELVYFINEYLSEMCDIIETAGGTIDKFEGDAIIAFFGAPVYFEDHAVRATLACIDQQKKLEELRRRWETEHALPPALRELQARWEKEGRVFTHVRMGLASGPMVVGNMGSKSRTDYTMMGDTVNLAARFESGQKIYGTGIVINDQVYAQVKDLVEARKLDVIQVMGKEEPVTAYEVLDRKGALSPAKEKVLDFYNQGMKAYEAFQFTEARSLFKQALEVDPEDGPSILYVDRCEEYADTPPADLIFRAQTK
jgi:class 3 adenylate cyclase